MPLTWIEDGESRQATIVRKGRKSQSTYRKSYKVFGTQDDTALHSDANSRITGSLAYWQYPGVPGMQLRAEQYSVAYLGDDAWQVQIEYVKDGAEDGTEPLKRSRSFDTSGGTQHKTQAYTETAYAGGDAVAPYQWKAIGVDSNGVNGVEVVTPQLQWQETYDVPNGYVTNSYIQGVAAATGTVNNAAFRGFAAGEVLFVGCSGSHEWDDQKGRGPWSLTYRFVASPNAGSTGSAPQIIIGDIVVSEKKGHDYLWVRYEDATGSNTLLKKPKYVYVNGVYRESNFASLGIGTS